MFKVCKKYLRHYQKSVFKGEISPSKLLSLKGELNKIIDKKKDCVSIIKFINQSYFQQEEIGVKIEVESDLII